MKDYSGKKCLGCGDYIRCYDEVEVCLCGAPYHKECWEKVQTCSKCHSADKNKKIIIADSSGISSAMFSNIGDKLKGLAIFVTVIGIIGGIITAIVMCFTDEALILPGLLTGIAISLCSWLGSFALYGFGALISYTQENAAILSTIANALNSKEKQ